MIKKYILITILTFIHTFYMQESDRVRTTHTLFTANDDYYRFDNARIRAGPHICVGCGAASGNKLLIIFWLNNKLFW
jgi:hypothetical protein